MKLKLGIKAKLFLTMATAVLALVVGMLLLVQWSFSRGFMRYVHELEAERLEQLRPVIEQSLDLGTRLDELARPRNLRRVLAEAFGSLEGERFGRRFMPHDDDDGDEDEHRPTRGLHLIQRRLIILDAQHRPLHAPAEKLPQVNLLPLSSNERVVGYLGLLPVKRPENQQQIDFLQRQKRSFSLISYLMAALATLLVLPLAHQLVKRIRHLADGTRTLADGDFTIRLPIASSDELGQLARDFNHLALTLEKNELQRRQWVADISHELRTPLAILRGEIEALQDGIRPLSPEAIASLHGETERLTRLVEDLYQLALSDIGALDYRLRNIEVNAILEEALLPVRDEAARRELTLTEKRVAQPIYIHADPERLKQLFDNLLQNALKYTDAPGEIAVQTGLHASCVTLDIYDSPPGVANQEREKLFERLFRVEQSRHRGSGGAGLGLSICRNIAEGHNGTIEAFPSPLGGVWIQIKLPLEEASP